MPVAVGLGFLEVLVWITVASRVIARINESPWVALAFAGGFATGNAVGMAMERRFALGDAVLRMISVGEGDAVATVLRQTGQAVTTFPGVGRDGPVTMLYVSCPRRRVRELVERARAVDARLFVVVERADAFAVPRQPGVNPSGWRLPPAA